MTQPSFYIFGVPNGFDILDGDINTTSYFQSYYNPSKENTKFSIHRNTGDGGITYAYLKYNLSSGKGREGSFFGMALSFSEKAFCTDILKLYRLFDTIYEKVILADREILKPTDGTSYIQAKYTITRFSEKKEYIMQRVLSNLLTNLEKFADTFVDCSYTSENPDIGKRVPLDQANNNELLALVQEYNHVSISPDWPVGGGPEPPTDTIPPELLWSWNQKIKERSLYVNKCYRDLSQVKLSEVKKNYAQINQICESLKTHPYPKGTDSAVLDCYDETYREYRTLKKDYSSLILKVEEEQGGGGSGTPPPPPPQPLPDPWWKDTKILGSCGVVVVVILLCIIGYNQSWFSSKTTGTGNDIKYSQIAWSLVKEGKYDAAIDSIENISDKKWRLRLKDSIYAKQDTSYMDSLQIYLRNNQYAYTAAHDRYINSIHNDIIKEEQRRMLVNMWDEYLATVIVTNIEQRRDTANANEWIKKIKESSLYQYSTKAPDIITRLTNVKPKTSKTPQPVFFEISKTDQHNNKDIRENLQRIELGKDANYNVEGGNFYHIGHCGETKNSLVDLPSGVSFSSSGDGVTRNQTVNQWYFFYVAKEAESAKVTIQLGGRKTVITLNINQK